MAKYINADEMIADENEAYLSAQCKITDKVTRDINFVVHTKLQRLLADAPAAEVIERKRGKWVESNPQNSDTCRLIRCSECGNGFIVGFNVPYEDWIEDRNFCFRCGTDMRAEECTE